MCGAATVIVALADLVLSAWLVTVTTSVSAAWGAVYSPDWSIVPVPFAMVHLTPVLDEPDTAAENCCCHLSGRATDVGEILIDTVCGADTLTTAEADVVLLAALVAVTV